MDQRASLFKTELLATTETIRSGVVPIYRCIPRWFSVVVSALVGLLELISLAS